ncbi:hypothetical protein MCOR29_005832 [Pyricularia oryzae]|nr:hypothetical protein MCOR26_003721 [Pyricularia oryzae]KAI6318752.1 hypothetical protein MCOR29_005832 [Pyricularia oryzae]KAI6319906.1 hypothetical protein MCOR30_008469 [Pyricularia oryzae]KAI6335986.1 hypothetical protein MCOR28_009346 [Pyricularia oryzae]KAI6358542.1 hypothetical protein MCOR31_009828 [Pyricularia oryzae]
MQPSTLLAILAVSAASLVSASPATDQGDSNPHAVCRRGGLLRCVGWGYKTNQLPLARQPIEPPREFRPTPPPSPCPVWQEGSKFGTPRATINGHCCLGSPKNALSCCRRMMIKPLPHTHELRCDAPSWQTAEKYTEFHECNTNQRDPKVCRANLVPLLPEIMWQYPMNPAFESPKPSNQLWRKLGPGSASRVPQLDYKPPGPSPLGLYGDGNPEPSHDHEVQKRGNAVAGFLLADSLAGSGPHRLETVADRAMEKKPKGKPNLHYKPPGKSRFVEHPYGNPDPGHLTELHKRSDSESDSGSDGGSRHRSANPLLDAMSGSSSRSPRRHRSRKKVPKAAAKALEESKTASRKPDYNWSPPGKSPLSKSPDGY